MHLSTRSPLIVSAPGGKSGQTCDRLVEFVDLYPTILNLVGLKPSHSELEGISFMPLLEKPRMLWKKAVFSKYGPAVSLITPRYNFVRFKDGEKMLFDLRADPEENLNLAIFPQQKENLARLEKMLRAGWKDALPPSSPAKE